MSARPDFLPTDSLARLHAHGQLPSAPADPSALADCEFGPVGECAPPLLDAQDPMEAFCAAWGDGFAPDTPLLRR